MDVFIFRPDTRSPRKEGIFYNNWDLLYDDLSAIPGPKIVQFDDSIISPIHLVGIPTKVYNMSQVTFMGMGSSLATPVHLHGITCDPAPSCIERGIDITQMDGLPAFILRDAYLWVRDGVQLVAQNGPIFSTPSGCMATVHMQRLCNAMGAGAFSPFDVESGGYLAIAAAYSVNLMNAFQGPSGAKVILDLMVGSARWAGMEPNWHGDAIIPNLKDQASRHFFNDTIGSGVGNVQAAIEHIAPKHIDSLTVPTKAQMPTGQFGFWKDTSTAKTYLVANCGGTIFTVELHEPT